MNIKLVFKMMVLLLGLLLVVMFRQYSGSKSFKEAIGAIFGSPAGPKNSVNWCVDQVVDVAWVETQLSEKMKQLPMADLRDDYCELPTEPITDLDLDKVQWMPLAESHGPTGQKKLLEWNVEFGVFRAGGLPFKSSEFAAQLKP